MTQSSIPDFERKRPIVVVSGLPRSGTSMMMRMLEAGGLPPLTDYQRTADDDNHRGYYEFERVKKLKEGDTLWLPAAEDKAVKIIAALLPYLPPAYRYRVIFMRRAMPEILASQRRMLVNRGEDPGKFSDEELATLFEKHLTHVYSWMNRQTNIERIDVNYNELLERPAAFAALVNRFLDNRLDESKMIQVVDDRLHRQRHKG